MSLSLITTAVLRASEEAGDPAVPPWVIGAIALGILLALLLGLIAFGGGREHS
ncbi:hypothetical protein [Nocardioides sp.]|jgi:high-affinity Fe2+/Pb2+ permease|uniref:hypothetical protein n=1 Tax=Nocardioides sp. TaxID=35761 RepID=UPI001E1AE135|nr:hypothetical protein [Nocardioides sp.]MBU1801087.1 hypothetical protein [Actinomycetota bacterium]